MNWQITVSGVPISDEAELRQQLEPLLLDRGNLDQVITAINTARTEPDPYQPIEDTWMDQEPSVVGVVGFVAPPSDRQNLAAIPAGSDLAQTMDTVAGAYLVNGLGDNFLFTEDRVIIINPNNPPTLEQSYEAIRRVCNLKDSVSRIENFTAWNLGALMDQLENFWGPQFEIGQAMETSGRSYNTVITSLSVYRAFRLHRFNLPFTHHKEVHYASNLDDDQKLAVLQTSERLNLTATEQRKHIAYVKRHGLLPDLADIPDAETLLQRVDIRVVSTKFLFRYQDAWHRHTGSLEALPRGATEIFNLDRMEHVTAAGAEEIPRWNFQSEPAEGPGTPVEAPAPAAGTESQVEAETPAEEAPAAPPARRRRRTRREIEDARILAEADNEHEAGETAAVEATQEHAERVLAAAEAETLERAAEA